MAGVRVSGGERPPRIQAKSVLTRVIGTWVRDLLRMICASLDVEIVRGTIHRDHVHLLVSVPLTLAVSRLVQRTKGLTSRQEQVPRDARARGPAPNALSYR
jgi:REP element-mobilizing transposase RayT